jgi:hypothetical protein
LEALLAKVLWLNAVTKSDLLPTHSGRVLRPDRPVHVHSCPSYSADRRASQPQELEQEGGAWPRSVLLRELGIKRLPTFPTPAAMSVA